MKFYCYENGCSIKGAKGNKSVVLKVNGVLVIDDLEEFETDGIVVVKAYSQNDLEFIHISGPRKKEEIKNNFYTLFSR